MPRTIEPGEGYYQPPKQKTAPKTTPTQNSYWTKKAEQTRLEQEKYLQMMEEQMRKQWAQSNQPTGIKSSFNYTFLSGAWNAAKEFAQNAFVAPFTGQYYTKPVTNTYGYNQTFQNYLNTSAVAKSLAAAKPQSFLLQDMARAGYKIPNWSAPQKQVPQTFPLGSWAQNPDQYFGSGVNMGPQKPANMEYEAYVPIGYGGYSYGGGWGGGGGSSDYTSNPFYRGEATAQKPSYYAQYLTWRVK